MNREIEFRAWDIENKIMVYDNENDTYGYWDGRKDDKKTISKADFNKVWKDSTKEDILNQFYYEHNDLRELLKENGNKEEVIKRQQETIDKAIEYIKDILYPIGTCVNGSDLPYESIESLLNILQNGSDEK